jgi:hypothetical protein
MDPPAKPDGAYLKGLDKGWNSLEGSNSHKGIQMVKKIRQPLRRTAVVIEIQDIIV